MKETITLQLQQYTEVWRENNVVYEEWAKRKGLSYFELLTLLSLVEAKEDCTQTDICKQWLFPKMTVNCTLKNFEKKEWILLLPLERDRRNKRILFTPQGKAFAEKVIDELHRHERQVWQRLGEKRARALLESTALFNQCFRENGTDAHS